MNKDRINTFWQSFVEKQGKDFDPNTPFETWHFCNNKKDADELADLVLKGTKTATSSLKWAYEYENEPLPKVGDYSVITNWDGDPVCVIKDTEVQILPFCEVGEEVAFDEGEGDRSLAFWRKVHWHFFSEECKEFGREPSETMPVVVERFTRVFP